MSLADTWRRAGFDLISERDRGGPLDEPTIARCVFCDELLSAPTWPDLTFELSAHAEVFCRRLRNTAPRWQGPR